MRYVSTRLMLFGSAIVLCGALGAPAVRAQCPIDYIQLPDQHFGFGRFARALPDLDGDGVPDFAVGSDYETNSVGNGVFRIYSGATREVLHEFHSDGFTTETGDGTIADLDGDGEWEFVGGTHLYDFEYEIGAVSVFRQGQLEPVTVDTAKGEMLWYGRYLLNMGDVTGDGADNVLAAAGTFGLAPYGGVRMLRGIGLETVWEFVPEFSGKENRQIGIQVFAVGDLNNDGVQDCAFTVFYEMIPRLDLTFRSGANGEELFAYEVGDSPFERLVMLDDVDNDGVPDFVQRFGFGQATVFRVFSGADGSLIHEIMVDQFSEPEASVPDVDGDGVSDIVARSNGEHSIVVWSTMQGVPLLGRTVTGSWQLSASYDAIGDLDGDGRGELLLGRGNGAVEIQPIEYEGCLGDLDDVSVRLGTLLAGELESLRFPDDVTFDVRSAIGFSALEPDLAEIEVDATAHDFPQDFVSLQVDLALSEPNGFIAIRARNWQTKSFDLLDTKPVGMDVVRIGLADLDGADYVRASDGAVAMRLRTVVPAVFSAIGFDSFFDWVDVITR